MSDGTLSRLTTSGTPRESIALLSSCVQLVPRARGTPPVALTYQAYDVGDASVRQIPVHASRICTFKLQVDACNLFKRRPHR